MLYILTGPIQSGKTRWLQEVVHLLEKTNIGCDGVLVPGIWNEVGGSYEKLGIWNEMLPSHERVSFALKPDENKGIYANLSCKDTSKKDQGWYINNDAVRVVNSHFRNIQQSIPESDKNKHILIIDELGIMELERNKGLIAAVELLQKGPQGYFKHAIVVVREKNNFHKIACEKFSSSWDKVAFITPQQYTPQEFIEVIS